MDLVKQIGRYELPLLSVRVIKKREGVRALLTLCWLFVTGFIVRIVQGPEAGDWLPSGAGYDVYLSTGERIHFTEEEKQLYDTSRERHSQVASLYGMCRSLGLRG